MCLSNIWGHIRGNTINLGKYIHITGFGDYKIKDVEVSKDPLPAKFKYKNNNSKKNDKNDKNKNKNKKIENNEVINNDKIESKKNIKILF